MKQTLAILLVLGCLLRAEAKTVFYPNGNKALEGNWIYTGVRLYGDSRRGWVASWLNLSSTRIHMFDEYGQFHMPMPVFIQPDGACTLWYPDGSKWIEATYQHGILDGPLTVFFKDGSPQLKATYAAGFPVGRYESFDENGSKKVSGTYSPYPADELAAVLLNNSLRPRKSFNYSLAQEHAAGSLLYDNYKTSVPARREGTFEFAGNNGRPLARLNYTRGVLNGEGIYYSSGGRIYRKAVFRMDSLVSLVDSSGLDLIVAAQARIDEANRLRPAAARRSRDEEPTPKPASYRVDVRNGVIYSPDGHKMFTGKWKLTGAAPHRYNRPDYPSDSPLVYNLNQAMYQLPVDIQADGACAWWYPNGARRADLHYKQGILNGGVVFYDEQGNKELETVYKDGFPDGPVITYHRNGKTAMKGTYEPYRLSELDSSFLNNYKRPYIRYPIQGISTLNMEAEDIRFHATKTISATLYGKKNGPFYYYDSLGKTVLLVPYVHGRLDGDQVRYERPEAGVSIRTFRYQSDSLIAAYNSKGNDLVAAARRQEDSAKNHPPAPGDLATRPIYRYVEQPPEFKGDVSGYIRAHLKNPPEVLDYSVTGKVIVQFVVNADGSTSDITVVRSLSKACDEEAIRLVREMPPWKPGKQNGKPVDIWFSLPVLFDPEYTEPGGNGKKN